MTNQIQSPAPADAGRRRQNVRSILFGWLPPVPGWLAWLSTALAFLLVVWALACIHVDLSDDILLFWHGRVTEDLVGAQARITGHQVRERAQHVKQKPTRYSYDPEFELAYSAVDQPPIRGSRVVRKSYDSRKKAEAYLAQNFPLGSVHVVWFRQHRPERFLLSANEVPTFQELLTTLLQRAILFAFVILPLLVLSFKIVIPAIARRIAKRSKTAPH